MKRKTVLKIAVDIGMTVILLFLMAYELVGETAHEWLGVGIFVLFVTHHVLNHQWLRNVFKGKYTALRIWQSILVAGVFLTMIGSVISGIILSKHVFAFLPIKGGRAFARNLHMLSAYWGLVWMALHLGFHWNMMMGMAKRVVKKIPPVCQWLLRGIAIVIAGYGVYAFARRDIGSYMLLKNQFVFFDFEEPLVFLMVDYMAVLGLFVCIGHYLTKGLKGFWHDMLAKAS